MKTLHALLLCLTYIQVFTTVGNTTPIVTTYTDQTSFNAVSTTSLIDFEGITTTIGFYYPLQLLGNTFNNGDGEAITVCGAGSDCSGTPYTSASLVNFLTTSGIVIDLAPNTTAVGAIFANSNTVGNIGQFQIFGNSGLLFSAAYEVGDIGAGQPQTFFGWTVEGDFITSIEFFISDTLDEVVDNFQFGTLNVTTNDIPEPAPLGLLGIGILGLIGARRLSGAGRRDNSLMMAA